MLHANEAGHDGGVIFFIEIDYMEDELTSHEPLNRAIHWIVQSFRARGILVHSDCAQSTGKIPVDMDTLGVDMLSVAGHKLYAPKGVGALYIRKGTRIAKFMHGGEQENRRRSGTLNVPGIVGLGKAAELARLDLESEHQFIAHRRNPAAFPRTVLIDAIIDYVSADLR